MKKPRLRVEMIRWLDSTGHGGWQLPLTDAEADDIEHVSVGFVVSETKRCVVIACSVTDYATPDVHLKANDQMAIPKVAILSRKVIRT